MPKLRELHIGSHASKEGQHLPFHSMTNLTSLSFPPAGPTPELKNLSLLTKLCRLQILDRFALHCMFPYTALSQLSTLTHLQCWSATQQFGSLSSLLSLALGWSNIQQQESNAFSQLASLVHLTVTVRVSLFDDMALLGSLVNLQTLKLVVECVWNHKPMFQLDSLRCLQQLQVLEFEATTLDDACVTNIASLSQLTHLTLYSAEG